MPHPPRKLILALVIAAAIIVAASVAIAMLTPQQTQPNNPTQARTTPHPLPYFEVANSCVYPITATLTVGKDVTCGSVSVPELHQQPNGKSLQLTVIIYKQRSGSPARDAIIVLQGGPGGSSDSLARVMEDKNTYTTLTAKHDVILFDQRGAGHSLPSLDCSALGRNVAADPLECAKQLQGKGINLAAYNTAENAADVNDIRRALGYDKLDVYGLSYGTLLAQVLMRDHPEAVRDVVLDSVLPLGRDNYAESPTNFNRSLTMLFSACAADQACNAAYPRLQLVFHQLVGDLNYESISVPITNLSSGKTITETVTGDTFAYLVTLGLYSTSEIAYIPKIIYDTSKGDYHLLGRMLTSSEAVNGSISRGAFYSVLCADVVKPLTSVQIDASFKDVLPQIVVIKKQQIVDIQAICKDWPASGFNQPPLSPLHGDLPTLVFGADYDPITPPAYSQQVAANLSDSYYVELPASAHASSLTEPCAFGLMSKFLDDAAKPDPSCAANQRLKFVVGQAGNGNK